MNQMIRPAPVRRSVSVKLAPDRAFDLFAAGMRNWWPATHSIGSAPLRDVVIEPKVGGRWYEIGEDGSHCEWGHVIAYEPPTRLLLAWQIGADWKFDPALVTEVELHFTALPGGGTQVDLEHHNLERFGEQAETVRGMIDAPEGGWLGLLTLFAAAADKT